MVTLLLTSVIINFIIITFQVIIIVIIIFYLKAKTIDGDLTNLNIKEYQAQNVMFQSGNIKVVMIPLYYTLIKFELCVTKTCLLRSLPLSYQRMVFGINSAIDL